MFVSSVCDAYQPLEKRYGLTRQCLAILIDAGFYRGYDEEQARHSRLRILEGHANCDVGCTLTTMDESLRFRIEPRRRPGSESPP